MPLVGHIVEESTSNFAIRVQNEYLTIDKTEFIRTFLLETAAISLITQPRRFGKSMTMSMLQYFCAATVDGVETKGLFDQFTIAKVDNGAFLKEHQGQYPVISVSFKDIKDNTYEKTTQGFSNVFSQLYRQHKKLLNNPNIDDDDKREFRLYLEGKADDKKLQNALQYLSEFLYKAHGNKRVILLIDEYDAPLTSAYEHQFLAELSGFMRNLFSAALKDNQYVQKGTMFGVLRVSQSEMLSGLNNLRTYTVLDSTYQKYFGFTEPEVKLLLQCTKLLESNTDHNQPSVITIEKIRRYYNGYKVGETILYNPWSMMQFLSQKRLDTYWVFSASEYLLKKMLLRSRVEDKAVFGQLIQQQAVEKRLKLNVRYEDLMEDADSLWSLLLFGGYLTVESQRKEQDQTLYSIKIPNHEVLTQYTEIFAGWLKEAAKGEASYNTLLNYLTNGEINAFTEKLGELMLTVLSVKDVSGDKEQPERFYHGLVIGLIASLRQTYHVFSNREGGLGFYDALLLPKAETNQELAIILEFKRCTSKQDMAKMAEEAKGQIQLNHYEATLKDYPHVKSYMAVGLAFRDKSVMSSYEKRNAHTGELIGDSSLSEEYGDMGDIDVAGPALRAAVPQLGALDSEEQVSSGKASSSDIQANTKKRERPVENLDEEAANEETYLPEEKKAKYLSDSESSV